MQDLTRKLLENYYASFNQADWKTFLSLLADDVVHDVNQSSREIGREAFAKFMERMNRSYSERITDIVVMVNADGSRAAVEFTVLGTYLRTDEGLPEARGQKYRLPAGAFFEIRDDKVARVTNYYNLEDWLGQVGADTVSCDSKGVREAPICPASAPTSPCSDTVTRDG